MSKVSITKSKLDNLANAVAAKSGIPVLLSVDEMTDAVLGISVGEENVLEGVKVNGIELPITNKKVNIPVVSQNQAGVVTPEIMGDIRSDIDYTLSSIPTKTSDLTNDSGFITTSDYIYMQIGVDYVTAGQKSNTTLGSWATAEGHDTTASAGCSHAEGYGTIASGSSSHAEGYETTASESDSHAEGGGTTAEGIYSHAEGNNTVAHGAYSHAEGNRTTASGSSSHAEGGWTTASGDFSHAEGNTTTASGSSSHAEGENTIAQRRSQHVFGIYNIPDTTGQGTTSKGQYIEIVGNGTDDNNHSNARVLDWYGNEVLAGKLTVGTVGVNSMDVATIGQLPTVPINVSSFTNDAGYLTSYTETDPVYSASAAAGITSTDITNWNSKTSNTGTVTSVGLSNATNGGLTISGSPITTNGSITVGHTNVLSAAQTTEAVYPIKIDKNGHISAYGTAVTSMPASDVYEWAKAASKPTYTFSELTTHPTSISGYGITDAYTKSEVDSKVSAVLKYKGVKATIGDLPSTGNTTGDTWHVTATSGEYAWDGTEWQELGTAISIPANTGSSTTGISIANHSTDSIYGVSSSTTSVYGVSTSTTTASKVTVGSSTDYGVTAAGSGSASLTFTMDSTDTKKLKISFTHTHTAPTLGSKVPTVSASDVTVPIKNADATTVPIKNAGATTVVTGATHSVTDTGHTHTI